MGSGLGGMWFRAVVSLGLSDSAFRVWGFRFFGFAPLMLVYAWLNGLLLTEL